MKFSGMFMISPYFWGEKPIGIEVQDPKKAMVDKWWEFVCPSNKGNNDPLINTFVDEAPKLEEMDCDRILVCVAEMDILRDRGIFLPSPLPVLYHVLVLPSLGIVTAQLFVRFSSVRFITFFLTFSINLRVYRSKFSPSTTNEWPVECDLNLLNILGLITGRWTYYFCSLPFFDFSLIEMSAAS
ncbi:putative carboxylesterase 2 [Nicotiana attenuata]|uniref:Carboxylesterase 2 n=1 Tax=Nicotiana attenuata TaxID=49451 RepID=A0A1J6IUM8_NICAT|nr:putative carboxylesterase 2 [Nicotiana attenuata]